MLLYLFTLTDEPNYRKIERIYNAYHSDMMDYARIKFWDAGRKNFAFDAEDAVQNTFVKITRNIEKIDFSVEEKHLRGFVFSILTNEIYNILREKEFVAEIDADNMNDVSFNSVETLIIVEKYDEAIAAMRKMDDKYSSTLYLAICEEMPVKNIAKMMGISEKTVYTRLARGKQILIKSVKEVDIDG